MLYGLFGVEYQNNIQTILLNINILKLFINEIKKILNVKEKQKMFNII